MTKVRARKKMINRLVDAIEADSAPSATELVKTITVYDAILWISELWDEIPAETIRKCFSKQE